jgi:hypothetical protein
LEDWKIGRLEDWKIGRLEDWKMIFTFSKYNFFLFDFFFHFFMRVGVFIFHLPDFRVFILKIG